MYLHRSNDGWQFCTVVCLLTSRQGEGAISVVVDAKQYSTAHSSEPRVLIADTCSICPGHDTVVVFGFPYESLIRKDTVWLSAQTTDSGSSRKVPHLEVLGGHVKRSRLLGACLSRRSASHLGHLQRMCSSSSGSSPQNRYRGNPAPWQSNCLFCVQTQPQRGSRRSSRFSGGILVLFIALVVAPHMSLRLFPAFLLSASRSP